MLFFFKLQQADWQLLFGKVFSPLPWTTVAYDTINSRVRRQRELRKDYEDEVSDRIALQDLFFHSPWDFSAQTKMDKHSKSFSESGQKLWRVCVVWAQTVFCTLEHSAQQIGQERRSCRCLSAMGIPLKKTFLSLTSIISMHGEEKFMVK